MTKHPTIRCKGDEPVIVPLRCRFGFHQWAYIGFRFVRGVPWYNQYTCQRCKILREDFV